METELTSLTMSRRIVSRYTTVYRSTDKSGQGITADGLARLVSKHARSFEYKITELPEN